MTLRLAEAYRQMGHEVRIISCDDFPIRWAGHLSPSIFSLFLTARLLRKEWREVDVIDASTGDGWLPFAALSARKKRPLYVTRSHGLEHCFETGGPVRFRARLYSFGWRLKEVEWSVRLADLALLSNTRDREFSERNFGGGTTYRTFRNGVNSQLLGRPGPSHSVPAEPLHIVQIGSFLARKGIAYSTPALARFLEAHPDARCSLLGTGVAAPEILSHFPTNTRSRVAVVPHYDNELLPTLIEGAQVSILASLSEGQPLVVAEAMACGLAPVITNIPGPTELVRDEHNGLVVAPRDSGAISAALERLNSDRDLLQELRTQAHRDAQGYDWPSIAAEQIALYEAAIESRSG